MNALKQVLKRANTIRLMIFDVDGVLTDGRLYYTAAGEESKVFHVGDGLGIKMLKESGVKLALLSGRSSKSVEYRARELGVHHTIQGVEDKYPAFRKLIERVGLNAKQVAYMGDDLPDILVMRCCGLAIAPAQAHTLVKKYAHYITRALAGQGAAREACEFILRAQNNYALAIQKYTEMPDEI